MCVKNIRLKKTLKNILKNVVLATEETSSSKKVTQLVSEIQMLKAATGPDYITIEKSEETEVPAFLKTDQKQIRNRKLTAEETAEFMKCKRTS